MFKMFKIIAVIMSALFVLFIFPPFITKNIAQPSFFCQIDLLLTNKKIYTQIVEK